MTKTQNEGEDINEFKVCDFICYELSPIHSISNVDTVAEWLRRQIRNLLEFLRAGSSPVGVAFLQLYTTDFYHRTKNVLKTFFTHIILDPSTLCGSGRFCCFVGINNLNAQVLLAQVLLTQVLLHFFKVTCI